LSKCRKVLLAGTDIELDTPLVADGYPLKILWVTKQTVKEMPTGNTNTDLAKLLCLTHVVRRIKEIHIYLKTEGEI
jgi:hypothetical protein